MDSMVKWKRADVVALTQGQALAEFAIRPRKGEADVERKFKKEV